MYLPCQNPHCRSHGKSHPNCKCYSNISTTEKHDLEAGGYKLPGRTRLAVGGEIHYCSDGMPHHKDCQYYAEGGDVEDNREFGSNPDLAIDRAVSSHGLHHLLKKTGASKSPDHSVGAHDFMSHVKRGQSTLGLHFNDHKEQDVGNADYMPLKEHLEELREDPSALAKIGGSLGQTFPIHASAIAAKAGNALNYFSNKRPMNNQMAPLSPVYDSSKFNKMKYHQQLEVAQNPMMIMNKVKTGTLSPSDLVTLNRLYPQLANQIREKASETVATAQHEGTKLPYKYRQGLSMLLGQPLDFTLSQKAMQAIIQSNSSQEAPALAAQKAKPATDVMLKEINMSNRLEETPLQRRQIDQKD